MNGPAVTGPFGLGTALAEREQVGLLLSLIHISEPTRQ